MFVEQVSLDKQEVWARMKLALVAMHALRVAGANDALLGLVVQFGRESAQALRELPMPEGATGQVAIQRGLDDMLMTQLATVLTEALDAPMRATTIEEESTHV